MTRKHKRKAASASSATIQEHVQHLLAGIHSIEDLSDQKLLALCQMVQEMIKAMASDLRGEPGRGLSTEEREEYTAILKEAYDVGARLELERLRRQMNHLRTKLAPLIEQQKRRQL